MMNIKHRLFVSIYSIFLFLAAFWASFVPQTAHAELDGIPGAGFIIEEGEYLSDQVWTNDDNISVGIELITSGGSVSFELAYLGAKYTVHLFFNTVVKPLEFWINFIQTWHYETGLRVPEDFRMMSLMMIDQRVDVGWFQAQCAALSEREGWDHVYEYPFAIIDNNVVGEDIEGGMDLIDDAVPRDSGQTQSRLESGSGSGFGVPVKGISLMSASPAVVPPASFRTSINVTNSKVFERYVNAAAEAGYLKGRFGIPNKARLLDLSYHRPNGVHGPDGFFIGPDGKCYLLESKWHGTNGGTLGKIRIRQGVEIVQGSPEWLQKALLKIKEEKDPDRWRNLVEEVRGTRFSSVLEGVEHVDEFLKINSGNLTRREVLELKNFHDIDTIKNILSSKMSPERISDYGKFWGEDFHFGVVNKVGGKPGYFDEAVRALDDFAAKFGRHVSDISRRVVYAKIKT